MPEKIFISYRREDSSAAAGRIYDRLIQSFPPNSIFMDIDTTDLGADFAEVIENHLANCTVFLAIIGPRWSDARDVKGARRLDNPNDFVRLEIAAALNKKKIKLIPVLLDGAEMPGADDLPEPLKGLSRRNAVLIRHERFNDDVDALVKAIGGKIKAQRRSSLPAILSGVAVLSVIGIAAYLYLQGDKTPFGPPPQGPRVVETSLKASPNRYRGPCPVNIDFTGGITVAGGAGAIYYKLLRSDNTRGPTKIVEVLGPGNIPVTTSWRLGGGSDRFQPFRGWHQIEVLDPQQVKSERAIFEIYCTETTDVDSQVKLVNPEIKASGSIDQGSRSRYLPPSIGDRGPAQTRGFFSFPLAGVDPAKLKSARLKLAYGGGSGDLDPSVFSTVIIEAVDIGAELDSADFDASGVQVARLPLNKLIADTINVTSAVRQALDRRRTFVTFRFRFAAVNDDDTKPDIWAFSYGRGDSHMVVESRY